MTKSNIKKRYFALGFYDKEVSIEYKKFGKEWEAFTKGWGLAKKKHWNFISKEIDKAYKKGWTAHEKALEEVERIFIKESNEK